MTWGSRTKFFLYGALLAVFFALLAETVLAQEASNDVIYTDSTTNSTVTTNGEMTTNVNSPPPSAISPTFNGGVNSTSAPSVPQSANIKALEDRLNDKLQRALDNPLAN